MAVIYISNEHKIYLLFHFKPLQIFPKLWFLVWKYTIWQPCSHSSNVVCSVVHISRSYICDATYQQCMCMGEGVFTYTKHESCVVRDKILSYDTNLFRKLCRTPKNRVSCRHTYNDFKNRMWKVRLGTDVMIFKNIFADKFSEKIGVFDSKQS
jgi:hypothetical protein